MNSTLHVDDAIAVPSAEVVERFEESPAIAALLLEQARLLARHSWPSSLPIESLPPGLYLTLLHGRTDPEQQLSGWGSQGPRIGPLAWVHVTYLSTLNLGFRDGSETGPLLGDDPMHFDADLLFYAGVWYGDWEIEWLPRGGPAADLPAVGDSAWGEGVAGSAEVAGAVEATAQLLLPLLPAVPTV